MVRQEVQTIPVKNLWVIKNNGLCLVNYESNKESQPNIDKSLISAFSSAFVQIIISTGLDEQEFYSITLENRNLFYYYENKLIIALEADKTTKERIISIVAKELHQNFFSKYSTKLKTNKLLKMSDFVSFKDIILLILTKYNLLTDKQNFKAVLTNILAKEKIIKK